MIPLEPSIASVRTWVEDAKHILVLTGAGISTESGIPDFRGPQGVWTKDPQAEKLSNIHYYVADPEIRKKSWRARLAHPAWTARPNAGHAAIVGLERRGKVHARVTQNIDGLHQKVGISTALPTRCFAVQSARCSRALSGWRPSSPLDAGALQAPNALP